MLPPVEECVYPDVGGDENKKREKEDLAVVQCVVDVPPVIGAAMEWFFMVKVYFLKKKKTPEASQPQ